MSDQEKTAAAPARRRTWCGTVVCLIVCATIAFVAYLFVSQHPEPTRRLWLPVVIETNGNQSVLGETRQMEFWTPSVKTKDYLSKVGGEVGRNEKWEVLASDDAVVQFGMLLHSNVNVLGYRRVEEWGQGRTTFKPGWWWTMNVIADYSAADLARIYRDYWKAPQPVLIEVIDNRGSK
jgi:hypothetical protein